MSELELNKLQNEIRHQLAQQHNWEQQERHWLAQQKLWERQRWYWTGAVVLAGIGLILNAPLLGG